jgi:hypothetical protein
MVRYADYQTGQRRKFHHLILSSYLTLSLSATHELNTNDGPVLTVFVEASNRALDHFDSRFALRSLPKFRYELAMAETPTFSSCSIGRSR